jgi:hypothetical protein
MATALRVNPVAAAEILPEIEAIAVRHLNQRLQTGHSDG